MFSKQQENLNKSDNPETKSFLGEEKIAEIPKIIDKTLLSSNGTLLGDDKKRLIDGLKVGHHKKQKMDSYHRVKRINSEYSITVVRDKVAYAHYNHKGKKVSIGKGATANVKIVQNLSLSSKEFAVAKIIKTYGSEEYAIKYKDAINEIRILRLLGRDRSGLLIRENEDGRKKFQYMMEMACGRELFHIIQNNELPYDTIKLLQISLNIAKELKAFFDMGYIHRDIKLENIFIDILTGKATLIDFALAIPMNRSRKANDKRGVGTPNSLPPEIYDHYSFLHRFKSYDYSEKTEVYALGKVLDAILFGIIESYTKSRKERLKLKRLFSDKEKIICMHLTTSEQYEIDNAIFELVDQMLNKDPNKRPSLENVVMTLEKNLLKEQQIKFPQLLPQKVQPVDVESKAMLSSITDTFFSFFASSSPSLTDLLNQGVPVMDESKKNSDGSLKQYLVFDTSMYSKVRGKLHAGLKENVDYRINEDENSVEIMGKIKMNEKGVIFIEEQEQDKVKNNQNAHSKSTVEAGPSLLKKN